jgi:8-oxo-dGTP pyrophosphatase MutT (NUDIX family)
LTANSAHIVIFNENGEALVVRRSQNDEWEPGKLAIPGGKLEKGENLLQGVQRETMEEVNLILEPTKILFLPQLSKKLNHCFFTTNTFKGEVKLKDGEHSEYGWINPKNLSETESVPNLRLELEAAAKMLQGFRIKLENKGK